MKYLLPLSTCYTPANKRRSAVKINSLAFDSTLYSDCCGLRLNFSLPPPRLAFLACGDFHARSCFARSTIPEEKWGLLVVYDCCKTKMKLLRLLIKQLVLRGRLWPVQT